MKKITKLILLNALLLACTTASADVAITGSKANTASNVERKARNGVSVSLQQLTTSRTDSYRTNRFSSNELQNGEKSKLFKKLPDHLVAANP